MAERGLVLTGARARLSIDGVPVMYTLSANYGEDITQEPIEVLDNIAVSEHVATAYRVNFSAQVVRVITNSLKLRDGVEIFPKLEDILEAGEMTATIEDRITGSVLANIERVKAQRYNINVGARAIVLTDVDFVAIRIRDESEIV